MHFNAGGLAAPVDENKVCDSAANATNAVNLATGKAHIEAYMQQ